MLHESLKGYFGLRAFAGKTFKVNTRHSYDDQIVIDIISAKGLPMSFSRGTESELLREVVPAPAMVKDGKHFQFEVEYTTDLMKKPADQIRYIMADAKSAADAMPDGKNAGFYLQEVRLCADALNYVH